MPQFKVGIEIHQQLEGRKLFCACPTTLRDDDPQFEIKRKQHAVAGEQGIVDVAAAEEQLKDKAFIYQGYRQATCLVETDSEPPHELNAEALYTALQFAKIVNAHIVPIIQVMRKTVIDGSNTSGFQRTALVAVNGRIQTSSGEVRIENISLEEDACRIITENQTERTYRLDRLGIPLIEIGTAPDITSPQQCQEAAKKIGWLLRSLPLVKRGLGTIRQDINVSIPGGTRIEIKGVQDLKQLPLLVELEGKRQEELLKIKEEFNGKKLNPMVIIDVTALFANSSSAIINRTIQKKGKIRGVKLEHFAGVIKRELQPNNRLGTEFSERAKVRSGVGGIFHSDELPAYGITIEEVQSIRKKLDCETKDAFILVAEEELRAKTALQAVYQRAQECLMGIPSEVRKANANGTTTFLRPIPGAARMYPETDVPLITPNVHKIKLPELLEEKISRYQDQFSLSKDLAEFIAKSDHMPLFEELTAQYPSLKPAFIAETLTSTLLEIKRKYAEDPNKLTEEQFRQVFAFLAQDKIHKDIMLDVLIDMIHGKFDIKYYSQLSTEDLHKILKIIVEKNKNAPFPALMGLAMKELNGKAAGKTISEELQRILKEGHQ